MVQETWNWKNFRQHVVTPESAYKNWQSKECSYFEACNMTSKEAIDALYKAQLDELMGCKPKSKRNVL